MFKFSYFIFVWLCTRDSTLPTVVCIVLLHATIEATCFFKENFRRPLFCETYFAKVVQLILLARQKTLITLNNVSMQDTNHKC